MDVAAKLPAGPTWEHSDWRRDEEMRCLCVSSGYTVTRLCPVATGHLPPGTAPHPGRAPGSPRRVRLEGSQTAHSTGGPHAQEGGSCPHVCSEL